MLWYFVNIALILQMWLKEIKFFAQNNKVNE